MLPYILFLLIFFLSGSSPVSGQVDPDKNGSLGQLSLAEKWIVQQVSSGKVADLQQHFGQGEKFRQVRARFLVKLLTDGLEGVRIPYPGIRIMQAVVTGSFDLENAEVNHWVELLDCRFQGEVNFRDCLFKKGLTLSRDQFAQKVEMQRLRVLLSANISESIFQQPLDLWRAQIGGVLIADGLRSEDASAGANFSSMTVSQAVFFRKAVFMGPVNFSGSKIGDVGLFIGTAFAGPVDFFGAEIGSQLVIMQGQFRAAANFGNVHVGSQFIADGARFHHPSEPVNFNGLRVSHSAAFRGTAFAGPVNFVTAAIGSELQFDGARFENTSQEVNFNNLKVSQHAFFRGANFHGPVDFIGADIGGEFVAIKSRFLYPSQAVNLKEIKVGATAYFWEATCSGGIDLSGAKLLNATIGFAAENSGSIIGLTLENAIVERVLRIEHIQIGQLAARKLTVKDGAYLTGVRFQEKADLRETSFSLLNFQEVAWPDRDDSLWLEGMTYQSVSAGEGGDDWKVLLGWLDQGRYDSRNYNLLETFFKQGGHKDRADAVFIQGKRRQVQEKWWRPDNLATLFFWDLLAGYGRRPERTFWISLVIVFIGMLVFDERNFDPTFVSQWNWLRQEGKAKTVVFRFFLSLDQFLPGIDLGLAKLWQLSQISFRELVYYHFHKISGWILIPIGLAAIYSQFK
ncbi:pentapeptide repeat-containing protein [Desulfobacca acetoxidans]